MKHGKRFNTYVRAALVVSLAALLAVMLGGCRDSDALKEILFTQTANTVDYDNPTKFKINDSTADEEDPELSALETSDQAPATDEVQNLLVYSSTPNMEGYATKQTLFSKYPSFQALEPSRGVYFYYENSADAVDEQADDKDETIQTEPEAEEGETVTTTSSSRVPNSNTSTSGNTTGSNGDGGEGNTSNTNGSSVPQEDDEKGEGGNDANSNLPVASPDSPTEPMPRVDAIAAQGDLAVAVRMFGEGALCATDYDTLHNETQSVFSLASEGVAQGWDANGNIDVDAIVASFGTEVKYGLVLCNTMSAADQASLQAAASAAGMTVYVREGYNFYSTYNMMYTVTRIGESLSESKKVSDSVSTATKYKTFVQNTLKECKNANGNTYAKDSEKTTKNDTYEANTDNDGAGSTANTDANYTLLVDDWDASGSLSNPTIQTTFLNGLAIAPVGYNSSPVSYYMQCGGVVNKGASAIYSGSSSHWVVSQFATTSVGTNSLYFTTSKGVTDSTENQGFRGSLLVSGAGTSTMYGVTDSLGTERFPSIVVTSQSIKTNLVENSRSSTGLYHPYSNAGLTSNDSLGVANGGNTLLPTCIGANVWSNGVATQVYTSGQIDAEDVLVNPCGLTGNWWTGNVESFLEAAWVCDVVNMSEGVSDALSNYNTHSNEGYSYWQSKTIDFYETFFGDTNIRGELGTIENGRD